MSMFPSDSIARSGGEENKLLEIPADLLEALRQDAPGAREKVIDLLWHPLMRYVKRKLPPHLHDEAEEVVNFTLGLAFKHTFYRHPAPVPYVYRVLKSQLSRLLKYTERHASSSLSGNGHDDGDAKTLDVEDELADRPDARLNEEELLLVFNELSPEDQDLLRRLVLEDKTLETVAASLNMTISAVSQRRNKAMDALRRKLFERGLVDSAAPPQQTHQVGLHPVDQQPIVFVVGQGAARHYLQHNKNRRNVPRNKSRGTRPPTLEEAVAMLAAPVKERKRKQR